MGHFLQKTFSTSLNRDFSSWTAIQVAEGKGPDYHVWNAIAGKSVAIAMTHVAGAPRQRFGVSMTLMTDQEHLLVMEDISQVIKCQ